MRGLVGVLRLEVCLVCSPKHNYVIKSLECECANVSDETMNLSYMKWRTPQTMAMEKAMFKGIQG